MLREIERIKVVKAKGKRYFYFKTNRVNENGKPIYIRMPNPDDGKAFWPAYASAKAGLARESARSVTVPELIDQYQRSEKYRGLSAGSKKVYDIYLRAFGKGFPTAPADKIERRDVARLMEMPGVKPGAAEGIRRTVSILYQWARETGRLTNDPCKDMPTFKSGEHQPWPDYLLEAGLSETDDRIRLIVSLLYYTGQRIGDVASMRWADIKDNTLFVTQEKTGKALEIDLHPRLRALLDTRERGLTTIIARSNGKPYDRETIRTIVQKWAMDNHGLKIVPHGLRKNAVNALLECGCSVAEVSSITGQSLRIVERYARNRKNGKLAKSAVLKWSAT